jgi:hypothetical protein
MIMSQITAAKQDIPECKYLVTRKIARAINLFRRRWSH